MKLIERDKGILAPPHSGILQQKDEVAWAEVPYTSRSFFPRHGPFRFGDLQVEVAEKVIASVLERGGEEAWNVWAVSKYMRELA